MGTNERSQLQTLKARAQPLKARALVLKTRAKAVRAAAAGRPVVPPKAPRPKGNPLRQYFEANEGRSIFKWMNYFDVYHRHFARFRGKAVTVVEFGVAHGGSIEMWKDYFGPKARIIGVDILPQCADFADEQVEIYIGDQGDREFLRGLAEKIGPIDVLIEDGGHRMHQQIATFEEFWPNIRNGGVFLIEDLHSSYWAAKYNGGYKRPGTFIEYAKDLIDQQNAWHSEDDALVVDQYTRSIRGMHVYNNMIVFDKADVRKPTRKRTGNRSF